MNSRELVDSVSLSLPCAEVISNKSKSVQLTGMAGSLLSVVVAAKSAAGGVHIVVSEDRESAAYIYNDLCGLMDNSKLFFFPTAYKRSILFRQEDAAGVVQRTAAMSAVLNNGFDCNVVICTYPEAVAEKVVTKRELSDNSLNINIGDKVSISFISDILLEYKFTKVDFVYAPGQYSVRGGILDMFSYSDNKPYRIDFFGDDVESIRSFDVNTQRSDDKYNSVTIVPNLTVGDQKSMVSFMRFLKEGVADPVIWINTPSHLDNRLKDLRSKFLKDMISQEVDPAKINEYITSSEEFKNDIEDLTLYAVGELFDNRNDVKKIEFHASAQPAFNKNFEILSQNLAENIENGYRNYIITENKAQIERLENILPSVGQKGVCFENISITLHEGFILNDIKLCLYTDHQIFEKYHRYKINNELPKADAITLAELNALSIGDYVTHIDHGVGRFGGMAKINEGGKIVEIVKLIYKDNDVLLVNVHSLHKISKFRDKEGIPPKIHKLGSGAWQRMKLTAKAKVKDIAKDLIALYAKRKATKGYAFSHDGYLQNELEASFMYEDTPDQHKATKAFKADMESEVPMDRLVCGDVGFGKTEIAMRAAFKAACDGKQTAVLVPTTVLCLQHYRTFSRRFREFPVKVENISRAKSAKQISEITQDLKDGKIDIIIGTHKLLGKSIQYKDLGLLIIDEEQKFGVSSKEKLRQIKSNVDTLTLTATPIPRTLQFSLLGARDLSVINTPPPNRQPVTTQIHRFNPELIAEAITQEVERGGQVYFIHNNIQTIEHINSIIKNLCPDVRSVIGHGQMPTEKLERVMMDFIYGEYDILIATTIIESGIDISNVNTIIINNAQNFGLSDLHQLRGRVGRSNRKAYCYLLTPEEETLSETSRRRLRAIEEFSDLGSGFNIAMQDLDIRGAGNLLGAEQSGFIADIGFETYQKILNEAVTELRNEGFSDMDQADMSQENKAIDQRQIYISDAQVDTDNEAHIPDSYVSNSNEKLRLYRSIDSMTHQNEVDELKIMLQDRFGDIPKETQELLNVVMIRRKCVELGFEKAIIKNGYLILHFIYNSTSAYYQSQLFKNILQFVSAQGGRYKLKHKPDKLLLSISGVKDCSEALLLLNKIPQM